MSEQHQYPDSITIKCYDPGGFDMLICLRGANGELMPRAVKALGWLKQNGFTPTRPVARDNAPPAASAPSAAANTPPPSSTGPAQTDTFPAETLAATVNDGKPYFKVKGGKFAKYGVMVWPEVLEAAGWDVAALDPMQTYNLTGHTAVYQLKDNGKPDKVVELKRE